MFDELPPSAAVALLQSQPRPNKYIVATIWPHCGRVITALALFEYIVPEPANLGSSNQLRRHLTYVCAPRNP